MVIHVYGADGRTTSVETIPYYHTWLINLINACTGGISGKNFIQKALSLVHVDYHFKH